MIYLTEADVRRFLGMREAIGLMRGAFERLAAGDAINQPRRRLTLATHSTLHYMAAAEGAYFGIKAYSTNPRHQAHFAFLLYRAEDGELLAMMEANYLGQIRTGAVSGLATSLLARGDARTVGIIGSGFQACSQLEAILEVRPIERVRVWSRSPEKRAAFAAECGTRFGVPVVAAASAEEAVRGADVLATATNAAEPVLEAGWVAPGTHINAMGSNQARRRELPADLVAGAGLVVVDSREQCRMEAGDLLLAFQPADWDRTVELQEVAAGRAGRSDAGEITIFKSVGLAVEDVAAAGYVYERAKAAGVGQPIYS